MNKYMFIYKGININILPLTKFTWVYANKSANRGSHHPIYKYIYIFILIMLHMIIKYF